MSYRDREFNGPALYTSYSGDEVKHFSYSMAQEMQQCGAMTKLKRMDGYQKDEQPAYLYFGRAAETAIVGWLQNPVNEIDGLFDLAWSEYRTLPLAYGKKMQSWSHMLNRGVIAMRRFQIEYENSKIPPMFDCEFSKDLYLEDWCEGTTLWYIADAINSRTLFDIKTTSNSRPQGFIDMVALDRQLRVGSLISGIRDVGLLVIAWSVSSGGVQWIPAKLTQDLVDDVDQWLRAQRRKYVNGEYHRSPGIQFPNQSCLGCEVRGKCLRNDTTGLIRRESRGMMEQFADLDDGE